MTSRLQPLTSKPATLVDAEQFIQMLNTILSATTESLSMLDRQGRYLFVSENGLQLSGIQQSAILGKTW
jgi:PAS domain-containing protein